MFDYCQTGSGGVSGKSLEGVCRVFFRDKTFQVLNSSDQQIFEPRNSWTSHFSDQIF